MIGTGTGKSLKMARIEASSDARNQYATNSSAMVKGRIVNNDTKLGEEEINDLISSYETLVLEEIKNVLKEALVLKKESKSGDVEVRSFWLVDIEAAHEARMKALKNAMDELQMTQKYGSEVSNWIDEGLNK